jgi:hypothetical protein
MKLIGIGLTICFSPLYVFSKKRDMKYLIMTALAEADEQIETLNARTRRDDDGAKGAFKETTLDLDSVGPSPVVALEIRN